MLKSLVLLSFYTSFVVTNEANNKCVDIDSLNEPVGEYFAKNVVPKLEGLHKGDAGKIVVVGGSSEYTGAPYFAAISALKAGADLVYVLTTASAAPVIKSYSPDLIVHPTLSPSTFTAIEAVLRKADVIVIGPGLGRTSETVHLTANILNTCRTLRKPLVIDADGLYVISKDVTLVKNYPSPGIIMTPNHLEAKYLKKAVEAMGYKQNWQKYWGPHVSVLVKGATDSFYGNTTWEISDGGSQRRAGGQGDILSGSLGTFFGWAIKANVCASVPTFAAARLTRACNELAFAAHGRSMTASDMLLQIHAAFEKCFGGV
ncbi:ATP-dependent (S)-NAD(P)H-hydrate dehydratase-like [Plutella xylostella]|uniref:ATP-dependent (S)-NAD(P)H-hydrate dehydratase-like n=1 Tax=Plutella xylostella TaxID=51655 RepID=UPI0020323540|nr:ATP-dependent (S)-NAD(P)H-hydrate dehydratase-like [Plutella xylostella]